MKIGEGRMARITQLGSRTIKTEANEERMRPLHRNNCCRRVVLARSAASRGQRFDPQRPDHPQRRAGQKQTMPTVDVLAQRRDCLRVDFLGRLF